MATTNTTPKTDNRTGDEHFPDVYVYSPATPDDPATPSGLPGLYRRTGREGRALDTGIYRREYENASGCRIWLDADGNVTEG